VNPLLGGAIVAAVGTVTGYDSAGGHWPPGGSVIFAYVTTWPDNLAQAKAAAAGRRIVTVSLRKDAAADELDIERGDGLTTADAPGWYHLSTGKPPKYYVGVRTVDDLVGKMTTAGYARNRYAVHAADYTDEPHLCGPRTCGHCQHPVDATQWAGTVPGQGGTYDADVIDALTFFAQPPAPKPVAHVTFEEDSMQTPVVPFRNQHHTFQVNPTSKRFFHQWAASLTGPWTHEEPAGLCGVTASFSGFPRVTLTGESMVVTVEDEAVGGPYVHVFWQGPTGPWEHAVTGGPSTP